MTDKLANAKPNPTLADKSILTIPGKFPSLSQMTTLLQLHANTTGTVQIAMPPSHLRPRNPWSPSPRDCSRHSGRSIPSPPDGGTRGNAQHSVNQMGPVIQGSQGRLPGVWPPGRAWGGVPRAALRYALGFRITPGGGWRCCGASDGVRGRYHRKHSRIWRQSIAESSNNMRPGEEVENA